MGQGRRKMGQGRREAIAVLVVVAVSWGGQEVSGQAILFAGDFDRFKQQDGSVLNISGIGQWTSGSPHRLGQGLSLPAEGKALGYDANSGAGYVGGSFHLANGEEITRISRIQDSAMHQVDKGVSQTVEAMRVHPPSGLLFLAGVFADATGIPVGRVTAWNGTEWDILGGGVQNPAICFADGSSSTEEAVIYDLVLLGGDAETRPTVFVGGRFRLAGLPPAQVTAHHIAKFDPLQRRWSALCDPNPPTRCDTGGIGQGPRSATDNSIGELEYVFALAIHPASNRLFVGGIFGTAGQKFDRIQSLAAFDLTTSAWSRVGGGIAGANPTVYSLHISGDQLWVAGFFAFVGKQNEDLFVDGIRSPSVASYGLTTGRWTGTGTGMQSAIVHSVTVDSSGVVYCGGAFTTINTNEPTAGLAKYEGGQWSPMGVEILSETGGPGIVYAVLAVDQAIDEVLPSRVLASDAFALRISSHTLCLTLLPGLLLLLRV